MSWSNSPYIPPMPSITVSAGTLITQWPTQATGYQNLMYSDGIQVEIQTTQPIENEIENMSINVAQLETYIKNNLNVLIVGPAGTGKTAMLKEACANLKLRMKYYNAATLDPFADLLGIPVPNQDTKTVEYYRPHDVDNAEVIFCDELNRASTQTTNAIFEMIQFRSINGEPLSKLRCVVAAMNPVEAEYDTDELDIALLDRFDVYLNAPAEAYIHYFIKKFGKDYARVGIEIFNEYQKDYNAQKRSKDNKQIGYLSPRRLDKLMEIFQKFPTSQTVSVVLPNDVILNAKDIADKFNMALGNTPKPPAKPSAEIDARNFLDEYYKLDISARRNPKQAKKLTEAYNWSIYNDSNLAQAIKTKLANDLNWYVSAEVIDKHFKDIVQDFDSTQLSTMMNGWNYTKICQFSKLSKAW